jgi:hypothetical protein
MYYNEGGLGLVNPGGSASGSQGAVSNLLDAVPVIGPFLSTITNFLHIGAGRHEADQIVPTQNEFGDFLAKASAFVPVASNVAQLQQLAANLTQGWREFQIFVSNKQQFPDGRAGSQALASIGPLVDTIQQQIADRIAQLGGGDGPMQVIQAGIMQLVPSVFGGSNVPQAGTLPYYPPERAGYYYGSGDTLSQVAPVAILGGLAWFLFGRRSR